MTRRDLAGQAPTDHGTMEHGGPNTAIGAVSASTKSWQEVVMSAQPIKVALLGAGVVGSEVARLLVEQADDLAARVGAPLEIVGIGVRTSNRERALGIDQSLITTDLPDLLSSTKPDIVVEVMGGIEPARELILQAFDLGASVVTANKALLAYDGATLHQACAENGADLYYEASVAGAIPLLRPLRESLVGDRVQRVLGIVNGTTNYILTRMDEAGVDFDAALAEAQQLGYAEADPSSDIEGTDAAAKAAIIASLAFHSRVSLADVHCEGITALTAADVAAARATDHVIKLLAIAERASGGRGINVRVHPAMLPRTHPLAGVREAYNAVFVESDAAGQLMFYGRGAGGAPTASAILGDIVAVARNRISGGHGPRESTYEQLPVLPIEESSTRYYLCLDLADQPGVLAAVAAEFATHGVSIETLRQDGHGDDATLLIVTHTAREGDLAATIETLRGLDSVREVASVMRVVGE
jgi:homoserine dehydrogenase